MKTMYVSLTYLAEINVEDNISAGDFQDELYRTIGDDTRNLCANNWEIIASLNDIEVEDK